MAERLNAPVLKTGNRDERFVGSNPTANAKTVNLFDCLLFCLRGAIGSAIDL